MIGHVGWRRYARGLFIGLGVIAVALALYSMWNMLTVWVWR